MVMWLFTEEQKPTSCLFCPPGQCIGAVCIVTENYSLLCEAWCGHCQLGLLVLMGVQTVVQEYVHFVEPAEHAETVANTAVDYTLVLAADQVPRIGVDVDCRYPSTTVAKDRSGKYTGAEPLVRAGLDDVRRPKRTDQRIPANPSAESDVVVGQASTITRCDGAPDVVNQPMVGLKLREVCPNFSDRTIGHCGNEPDQMLAAQGREIVGKVCMLARTHQPASRVMQYRRIVSADQRHSAWNGCH